MWQSAGLQSSETVFIAYEYNLQLIHRPLWRIFTLSGTV